MKPCVHCGSAECHVADLAESLARFDRGETRRTLNPHDVRRMLKADLSAARTECEARARKAA